MLLIKNGHIKPITSEDLENGCVLIGDDGKINKVAEFIEAPQGCEVIDAKGMLVTPGLVKCPNCEALIKPHHVCPECGMYDGKEVVSVKEA